MNRRLEFYSQVSKSPSRSSSRDRPGQLLFLRQHTLFSYSQLHQFQSWSPPPCGSTSPAHSSSTSPTNSCTSSQNHSTGSSATSVTCTKPTTSTSTDGSDSTTDTSSKIQF